MSFLACQRGHFDLLFEGQIENKVIFKVMVEKPRLLSLG